MKTCIKCGAEKQISEFKKSKRSILGVSNQCKSCFSEYLKDYRAKNKDRVYAVEQEWRKNNPDKVMATRERWKEKNPTANKKYYAKRRDEVMAYVKIWYEKNKDRVSAYKREYYKKNPEVRPNGKAKRRSRIGSDKLPYGTIPKQYAKQNGLCACCGKPLGDKYHVDHIMPLALGGRNIPENIQLLLPVCNQRKSKKHPDVWRKELEARNLV